MARPNIQPSSDSAKEQRVSYSWTKIKLKIGSGEDLNTPVLAYNIEYLLSEVENGPYFAIKGTYLFQIIFSLQQMKA